MESWGKSVVSTTGTASAKAVRQGRPQLFQEYKVGHYGSSRVTRMCWETWLVIVVQSPSYVQLFATPRTAARQASLFLTISQSLPKFISIASVMSSSHLIFWCRLLFLPSIFPSIRDFSNESAVCIRDQNTGVLASASVLARVFRVDFLYDWLVWSCIHICQNSPNWHLKHTLLYANCTTKKVLFFF